jgi:cell division septation protein DedD
MRLKLPVPAKLKVPMASAGMAAAALLILAIAGFWLSARGNQTAGPARTPPEQTKTTSPKTAPPPPPPPSVEPGSNATPPAAASAHADPAGGYRIAVAAFKTSKRAIDVASDIAAKGFPVSTRADATGEWYQVVVGPFASPEAAATAQRALAREGFVDTRISPIVSER